MIIDPVGMKEAREENKEVPEVLTLKLDKDSDKVFTDLRFRHYQTMAHKLMEIRNKIDQAKEVKQSNKADGLQDVQEYLEKVKNDNMVLYKS